MASEEYIIDQRYKLEEKLGSGSFGIIYKALDISTNKYVALKCETVQTHVPQLAYEYKLYKKLNGSNKNGIPKVYSILPHKKIPDGTYHIMVMELLGPSLEKLFQDCNCKFSLKTVLQIAIQMIKRIEYIHSHNFLHRDIKPDNFTVGQIYNSNTIWKELLGSTIYAIDFGLSKLYRSTDTHMHIPYRENKRLVGTPRYASINMHLGIEQSRRDDLESIGYVLVYFLKGKLPWQGMKAADKKRKYRKIMEKKMATPIELLCSELPNEFIDYFHYVRLLRFADKPDYQYLGKIFEKIADRLDIKLDNLYDWDIKEDNKNKTLDNLHNELNNKINNIINDIPSSIENKEIN